MEDQVYCFEIARRSVGRAALHLGIDSMSEASLDVMADVLLSYLNRVGKSLSHLVESSGRSSSHVNILDAFRACEMVSAPVAQRLHLRDGTEDEQLFGHHATTTSTNVAGIGGGAGGVGGAISAGGGGTAMASAQQQQNTADWKGLAAFLFGPKWLEEKEEDEEEKEAQGPAGGKRGPSAIITGDNSALEQQQKLPGWNAPYLDEIPSYPLASDQCANPHRLPANVGLSLHKVDDEQENDDVDTEVHQLEMIPDDVFATKSWGDMGSIAGGGAKRKLDIDGETTEDPDTVSPPTKRARFAADDKNKDNEEQNDEAEQDNAANHQTTTLLQIPSFFPKPPITKRTIDEGRMAVDMEKHVLKSELSQETDYQGVRSSLVEQSGYYWGSNWDSSSRPSAADMAVPLGRTEAAANEQSSTVNPLGRASGSRVSRILEGSMDAAAMQ